MKKIMVGVVLSTFLFGAAFAGMSHEKQVLPEETMINTSVIEKTYEFKEPIIATNGVYATVSMDDTKSIMQEGKPVLPYRVDIIRFPLGTKIDVQVIQGTIKEIDLADKVVPCPSLVRLTTQQEMSIEEDPIYMSEEVFPEKVVDQRITVGLYDGERVATLSLFIYPCQYLLQDEKLVYTETVKVNIAYELPTQLLFTNESYDFLITCPQAWEEKMQLLVDHKESHGIKTKLVCFECIYAGEYFPSQGRDDAERVKYFINNAIEAWGIKYVMLVGGKQGGLFNERWFAPVRYTNLDDISDWESSYASDLYFSDIYKYEDGQPVFDNWDSNENGIFAEWTSSNTDILDLSPDVYVGRLACRNAKDVQTMVDKIITYENSDAKNQDWFRRVVAVAGDTFPPEDDPYIDGELTTDVSLEYLSGFESVKLYTSTGTLTGPEDVISAVNQGCGFLDFEGHGNPMGWATHPPYNESVWIDGLRNEDMHKLANDGMYPVCIVGGCHNSQFNVSALNAIKIWKGKEWYSYIYKGETAFKCWSWWLTSISGGGSIATIGNTGLGYGAIGDYNNDSIADALQYFGGWIDIEFFRIYGQEEKNILGDVHSTTITNYVAQFPINWQAQRQSDTQIDCKTVQEWVLLGDPTLMIGGYT